MNPFIRRLELLGLGLASLCICVVMLIAAGDTLMRYAFHRPWPWAFEVTTNYLLVGAAYLGISSTFTMGDHINIDLLHRRLPAAWRVRIDAAFALVFIVMFGLIGVLALRTSIEAAIGGDYIPGYVHWPVWLSFAPIPIGTAILCLRLGHHVTMLLREGGDRHVSMSHAQEGVE